MLAFDSHRHPAIFNYVERGTPFTDAQSALFRKAGMLGADGGFRSCLLRETYIPGRRQLLADILPEQTISEVLEQHYPALIKKLPRERFAWSTVYLSDDELRGISR